MGQARILLAAFALTVTVPPAQAADMRQVRRDCTPDALSYCAAAIPRGKAAIIKCMVKNRASLSPQCKRHIS